MHSVGILEAGLCRVNPRTVAHWAASRLMLRLTVLRIRPNHARTAGSKQPRGSTAVAQFRKVGTPAFCLGLCHAVLLGSATAAAAPGEALRLGGAEPQGAATSSVTAVHHNPALIASLPGLHVHASGTTGVEQLWVRRHDIADASGAPQNDLAERAMLADPLGSYFVGATFQIDRFALGLALYDLSSRYRMGALGTGPASELRYHLANDSSFGCAAVGDDRRCPDVRRAGAVERRQDLTFAAAYMIARVQAGVAVHLPRIFTRFAFDNDTDLATVDDNLDVIRCDDKENPRCAERFAFSGRTRWIPGPGGQQGLDVALTLGLSYRSENERISIGVRYRTQPLRRRGLMALSGRAVVCRPFAEQTGDSVSSCDTSESIGAELSQRIPMEAAIGGSFVLGRSKLWRIDANLYWRDNCWQPHPRKLGVVNCADPGDQTISLVGLDRDSYVLPQFTRHRGLQDVYGFDLYTSYRARSNLTMTFAGHGATPNVRPTAQTAASHEPWRVGATFGLAVRVGQSGFVLVPGYGLDVWLPNHVRPSRAAFDPTAQTEFEAMGGDINAPRAELVLDGRARPTNAGRYVGLVHTLTLAVRWSERGLDL